MARKHLIHIKSSQLVNGAPKLPDASQILEGEIAVNFGAGVETLSIKNSSGDVVTFTNDNNLLAYIDEQDRELALAAGMAIYGGDFVTGETNFSYSADTTDPYISGATSLYEADLLLSQAINDNERVTAAALNDLNDKVEALSSNTLSAGEGIEINANEISVKAGSGITIDEDNGVAVKNGSGITIDEDNEVSVNLGEHLEFDENEAIRVIVDEELDSGSTHPVANSAITHELRETELVYTAAFNDLNDRIESVSGDVEEMQYTLDEVYDYVNNELANIEMPIPGDGLISGRTIEDQMYYSVGVANGSGITINNNNELAIQYSNGLDLTSNLPVKSKDVAQALKDDEEVIAASLNDLNTRADIISGDVTTLSGEVVTLQTSKQDTLSAGTGIDITDNVISCTLDTEISEFMSSLPASGSTSKLYFIPNPDTGATTGNSYIEYAWHQTGATEDQGEWEQLGEWTPSLTIDDELDLESTNPVENQAIASALTRIEIVTAAALNTLNDNIEELSGNVESLESSIDSITYSVNGITGDSSNPIYVGADDIYLSGYTTPSNAVGTDPISSGDTVTDAFEKIISAVTDNEEIVSSAINALHDEIGDVETTVESVSGTVTALTAQIDSKLSGVTVNSKQAAVSNGVASVTLYGADVTLSGYTSPANNTDRDPLTSGDTINQAFSKVISAVTDDERVFAASLNEQRSGLLALSGRVDDLESEALSGGSGISISNNAINVKLGNGLSYDASSAITVDINTSPLEEVTYSELVTLKSSSGLTPGSWYRITDYQCTTTQANTSAATHQFDVVVLALSNDTLSEEARAMKHSGDTYFSGSTVNAWKIWYCLENDTTRFVWADTTNGKGVIYRMIDEFNNDIKYDFKNILFQRTITDGEYDAGGTNTWCYTLNVWHNNACNDASIIVNTTSAPKIGFVIGVHHNVFGCAPIWSDWDGETPLDATSTLTFKLGDNVVLCTNFLGVHSNTVGIAFCNNTIGNGFTSNTIGIGFLNNTIGDDFSENTIGNFFSDNTIGYLFQRNLIHNEFSANTIGNGAYGNIIHGRFVDNIIGNDFADNVFNEEAARNTIGNAFLANVTNGFFDNTTGGMFGNTIGAYFSNNTIYSPLSHSTIGNDVYYNTIGTAGVNSFAQYICIEDGVKYVNLTTTATTSMSNYLQNIVISRGISGTSSTRKTITHPTVGDTFKTTYQPANSQVISV